MVALFIQTIQDNSYEETFYYGLPVGNDDESLGTKRSHHGMEFMEHVGVNINESLIKHQTDAMVSKGLMDVGYDHINIDDGYLGGRDKETGALFIHPTRFPNGLRRLPTTFTQKA